MSNGDSREKLAVVLHADVVGSTSLVQHDRRVAHQRIQDAFNRLSQIIADYGGHTQELRGDALLAVFETASSAVSAGLTFQVANARHNGGLDGVVLPELRIGISLGEIIVADGTITGAEVVLAQRLEQLAPPGQVCISSAVRSALPRSLPFEYEDLEEQTLKGFDDSVHGMIVVPMRGESIPSPATFIPSTERQIERPRRQWLVATLVTAVLVTVGLLTWLGSEHVTDGPTKDKSGATPPVAKRDGSADEDTEVTASLLSETEGRASQKPSIAVLPFDNMSDDPKQDYFAEGISEDIITDLSKISGLFVIARNSSFAYKTKGMPTTLIAEELGVRYVLEGSVRPTGTKVRINAQLIDGRTGGHIWADRFDGTRDKPFELQELVLAQVIKSIAVNLTPQEQSRVEQRPTRNAEAYELFLLARRTLGAGGRSAMSKSRAILQKAIEIDPNFAEAIALLAETRPPDSRDVALRSLEVRENAAGYVALGEHFLWVENDPEQAAGALNRALELDSNNADAHQLLAGALLYVGRLEEAYRHMETANKLNPAMPAQYRSILGRVHFAAGRYQEAVDELQEVAKERPRWRITLAYLAASYVHMGEQETAARYAPRLRPSDTLRAREPYRDDEPLNRLINGVKAAREEK